MSKFWLFCFYFFLVEITTKVKVMKRNNKKNQKDKQKKKRILRCSIINRPVFEYETCPEFKMKSDAASGAQQNCKNCAYSY